MFTKTRNTAKLAFAVLLLAFLASALAGLFWGLLLYFIAAVFGLAAPFLGCWLIGYVIVILLNR